MDSESRLFFVALAVYSVRYSDSMYCHDCKGLLPGMEFFSIPYYERKGKYFFEIDELNLEELLQVVDRKVVNFLIGIPFTNYMDLSREKRLLIEDYIDEYQKSRLTEVHYSL